MTGNQNAHYGQQAGASNNEHEILKIHASKCVNNFILIIQINMSNLTFNMAWIDLNIKVYNRDDIYFRV